MRKIHILSAATFVVLLVSGLSAVSASALEWLESGVAISVAKEALVEGELQLTDLKVPLIGEVTVLCSADLLGTVGPGNAASITEFHPLGSTTTVTKLGASPEVTIACTNIKGCAEPLLTFDESFTVTIDSVTEILLNKPAAFEVVCDGVAGLSDLCEAPAGGVPGTAANVAAGVEVLFVLKIQEELKLLGTCSQGGLEAAHIESDGPSTIVLENGLTLSIS